MDNMRTDDSGTQISGRLAVLEMALTMIIARDRDPETFLSNMEINLASWEAQMRAQLPESDQDFILGMMEAARQAVDEYRFQIRQMNRRAGKGQK